MSAQIKDRTGENHPDPLRAALAAAIEAEAEARRSGDSARENLKRGHAVVDAAQTALEGARNRVSKARERDSRATAAAVRNRSSAAPDATSTRSARAAVQEQEDNLEVAQGAIARLKQDVAESETAVLWAAVDTMAARNAVLAPACRVLIERAQDFRRSLAVSRAMLVQLLNDPSRGAPEFRDDALAGIRARQQITAPLTGLKAQAEEVSLLNATVGEQEAVAASVGELRRAISDLMSDAATELPPLP